MSLCYLIFVIMIFGGSSTLIPVDENGRINENLLLIRSTASEKWKNAHASNRKTLIVENHDDIWNSSDIVAACIWKGFPLENLKDSIYVAKEKTNVRTFLQRDCELLELGFISYYYNEVLTVTWIDPRTKKPSNSVSELAAGEKKTLWLNTRSGEEFLVKGKTYEEKFTATVPSIFIVGKKPDYTTLGKTIKESDKVSRVRMELMRVRNVKRVFTNVGFKKVKVPKDVWAEISTYWYNNKNNRAIEEWLNTGFFVNWHEVNQDLVVPPFELKARWQKMFQHVVEEWTNTTLEPTDIYGIRTYYNGAWLSNHVDREETHAASAIINVEQIDVEQPWEVHIWDIYGNRHRVSMKPGEALLYESARCMHGRPVPLRGKEYTNIFVHYRPVGKPKWYIDPTIGFEGPDIMTKFDPSQAATHDIGWVGEDAEAHFPYLATEL